LYLCGRSLNRCEVCFSTTRTGSRMVVFALLEALAIRTRASISYKHPAKGKLNLTVLTKRTAPHARVTTIGTLPD